MFSTCVEKSYQLLSTREENLPTYQQAFQVRYDHGGAPLVIMVFELWTVRIRERFYILLAMIWIVWLEDFTI